MSRALPARVFAFAALALALAAAPAGAQVVRAFTPRYNAGLHGNITLIGNTIMTCSAGGACATAQGGSGASVDNDNFTMVYVDADGDASTFASSSATLTLPAGATVDWAGLYWGGYSGAAGRTDVRFRTPASGYVTVSSSQTDASGSNYKCYADVTTLVRPAGGGTYWTADLLSTPNQAGSYGGWSLIVVYRLATDLQRVITVFDGYVQMNNSTTVSVTASGFNTKPSGSTLSTVGFLAWDGDRGITSDNVRLDGSALSDGENSTNNVFNSTISINGAPFTAKNPNYYNQLGFDADIISTNGKVPNGSTSTTIQLAATNDTYYAGVILFSTEQYSPGFDAASFTKTVTDVNGGSLQPGDVLEYTITAQNTGQIDALTCVARDTLPANAAYVPGSLVILSGANAGAKTDGGSDDQVEYVAASRSVVARLGTGANGTVGGTLVTGASTSLRFRVTVTPPAPSGSIVSNQGWIAYVGQGTGAAGSSPSDGDPLTAGSQPTVATVSSGRMLGTVFEDANYGGGIGRSLAASGGTGRPGARVELYSSTGALLQIVRSDASGLYVFDGWPAGTYTVRAVNSSVRSARPGSVAGLLPVQTFRTTGASGAAVAVTDRVGGENPAIADADSNTTSLALASLTTGSATPQSLTAVTLGSSDVTGLDFGYNFDTIVSTRDSGPGTLRQFLLNANALGNTGLAQAGLTAGSETSVFMITDGAAHAGLRAGLANQLTAGVARFTLLSALPALTDAGTRVDGATQTANIGNTNAATLGGGMNAGTDAVAVAPVAAPEVELRDGAALAIGLDLQAANLAVASVALSGFGNAAGSNSDASVRIGAAANNANLTACVLGATASAWADPGAALRAGGDLVRAVGGDAGTITNCLLGWSAGSALTLASASDGWIVTGCELRGNAIGNPARGAISIEASLGSSFSNSWISDTEGNGVDARTSTGSNTFTDVTVRRSGLGTGGATAGLRLGGAGNRVDRCVVTLNYGAGIQVTSGSSNNTLTRNAVSLNGTIANSAGAPATGQVGIDLQSGTDAVAGGTAPFVTLNDMNDADAGGDALLNFPVLAAAVLANGSFTVTGWARPGATIELFVSDGDASGFGEGATYVGSYVEGSGADLDAGSGTYPATVNGIAQGTDMTNRFRFTVAAPGGVAAGVRLTATATIAGTGTSEFSGVVVVATGVTVSGVAYSDLDHNGALGGVESGTGLALFAKLFASGGSVATQVVSVTPATGAYAFTFVPAGAFDVHLDTDGSSAVVAVTWPAGWIGTENASGVRAGVTVNSTDVTGVNFGLWHGSRAGGVVFRDDGAAGGAANDGVRQAVEAGVANARVRFASAACAGGACDSALTDGAGAFTLWIPFTAAGPGARVQAVTPSGWLATGGGAGTTAGSYARSSDAVTFTAASGLIYSGLQFGHVPGNTWLAPQASVVAPGGFATYAHRFTAGSAGTVSFSTAQAPSPALPGWSAMLYRDLDCDGVLDAGEPVLAPASTVALAAGATLCVIERHAAPVAAPAGALETATLTASFTYTGASPALAGSDQLSDVTTVALANGLVLSKAVDLGSARPGDYLTYTITYTNPGPQPLSNIVISDATPAWTVFDSATCASPGSGITGCSLAQPAAGAGGPLAWTLTGALAPGGSGSVSYRVRVQ